MQRSASQNGTPLIWLLWQLCSLRSLRKHRVMVSNQRPEGQRLPDFAGQDFADADYEIPRKSNPVAIMESLLMFTSPFLSPI